MCQPTLPTGRDYEGSYYRTTPSERTLALLSGDELLASYISGALGLLQLLAGTLLGLRGLDLLLLLRLDVRADQGGELAAGLDQLLVGADLADPAALQHHDLVHGVQVLQLVRHQQACLLPQQAANTLGKYGFADVGVLSHGRKV